MIKKYVLRSPMQNWSGQNKNTRKVMFVSNTLRVRNARFFFFFFFLVFNIIFWGYFGSVTTPTSLEELDRGVRDRIGTDANSQQPTIGRHEQLRLPT